MRAAFAAALLLGAPLAAALGAGSAAASPLPGRPFADGSTFANLSFGLGGGEIAGPSVRHPAQAAVYSARVSVEGSYGYEVSSAVRGEDAQFLAGTLNGTTAETGALRLATNRAFSEYNASNAFGGGTYDGVRAVAGALELNNTTLQGSFTSAPLLPPGGGWGYFGAGVECSWWGWYPCGNQTGHATFDLVLPTGQTLATGVIPGSRVPASAFDVPALAVRVNLARGFRDDACPGPFPTPPCAADSPRVLWFGFGQRVAPSEALAQEGGPAWQGRADFTGPIDPAAFTKDPTNPVVPVVGGTYYSSYLSQPYIIKIGGTWMMFMSASTTSSYVGAGIARATSTDFRTWTFDATLALSRGATYDNAGMTHPFVIANPEGSGYLMYYSAWTSAVAFTLALATSPDGVSWTKEGEVLTGSGVGWDAVYTGHAARVAYNSTTDTWSLWYSGTDVTTGGGSSLGIALSSDGRNWSRYASNPVLTRGGAFDQDDLQGGKIMDLGGALYYYYDCNPGDGHYYSCLAKSTDGGYTWSKLGFVLSPDAGAFDSDYASDPFPYIGPDGFYLFYAGLAGTTSQIGAANGTRMEAVETLRFDLGPDPPLSLDAVAVPFDNAAAHGNTVIRSSPDASTWTAYEPVDLPDLALSTPAQRFVEVQVNEAPILICPAAEGIFCGFRLGLTLSTTSYVDVGEYTTDALAFSDPFDRARVDATWPVPGTVEWTLATDHAAAPAVEGAWQDLLGDSGPLRATARLAGNQSVTPRLGEATFTVRMYGLPADVALRFGANGTAIPVNAGPLAGTVAVPLPVNELNGWIGDGAAADPNATFIDVPMRVSSSHFGNVTLSGLEVNETVKKRLSATFSPTGRIVINETETAAMSATAVTEAGATIAYQWWRDGVSQTEAGAAFAWVTGYDDAGNHTARCEVSNGFYTIGWTWEIIVLNKNRPPVIVATYPDTPANISKRTLASFRVFALDGDGDRLDYTWTGEGAPLPSDRTNATTAAALGLGRHAFRVTVSDGIDAVNWTWDVNVLNAPPVIVAAFPRNATGGALNWSHALAWTANITAFDADDDDLTYTWYVDGLAVGNATGDRLDLPSGTLGLHNLTVLVSDGQAFARYEWKVNLTNGAPRIVERSPNATDLHLEDRSVRAAAVDPDGDALTYTWFIDGAAQGASGTTFEVPTPLASGTHTVKLVVEDPFGESAETTWTLVVPPEVATTGWEFFGSGVFLLFLLIAAVAAVAAYYRYRAGHPDAADRPREP